MNEEELVEALLKRFGALCPTTEEINSVSTDPDRFPPMYLLVIGKRVAEECLRQMEWARQECVESVDSFGAGNSWTQNKPLTLAPEGWEAE